MNMNLAEATTFILPAFENPVPGTWCDLGCGSGLFTEALASFIGKGSKIHAVDKSNQHIVSKVLGAEIEFLRHDFVTSPLPFFELDGILMANSLHFVKDKRAFLARIRKHLQPNGRFLFIEYELSRGNNWVPYPVTFKELQGILHELDLKQITKVGERDSVYGNQKMYLCSAVQTN